MGYFQNINSLAELKKKLPRTGIAEPSRQGWQYGDHAADQSRI